MNGLVALFPRTAYLKLVRPLPVAGLLLALSLVVSSSAAGRPPGRPEVVLLTMGPGESLYSRFGHAALMVRWPAAPSLVFNYGYTNFNSPDLVWDFLRGRARFWVARARFPSTINDYAMQDRTLYYQELKLDPAKQARLAHMLVEGARPENRYYVYHHFHDNCSTRLRDLVDRVTEGAVRQQLVGRPGPDATLRELVRRGFAGDVGLLLIVDLLLGRTVDRRLDAWEATFLPRELRGAARTIKLPGGAALAGEPRVLYKRRSPSPFAGRDPHAGLKLYWGLAVLGAALAVCLVLLARRASRWAGLPLLLLALIVGLPGLAVWTVMAAATLPELRLNELALSLWPLDLGLIWPAVRWLRGRVWVGRLMRGYALLRVATLGLVLLGHLTGLLIQQPRCWLILGAGFAMQIFVTTRLLSTSARSSEAVALPEDKNARLR
jgi:ketosteroid isomerase-like protein